MSEAECTAFVNDADHQQMILMRRFDELAKETDVVVRPFDSFRALLTSDVVFVGSKLPEHYHLLSAAQLQFWRSNGFLKVPTLLPLANISVDNASDWVDEIAAWPKQPNAYLQHYEMCTTTNADTGEQEQSKVICRTENFVNYHADMKHLVNTVLLHVVSQLFGEPAVRSDESINCSSHAQCFLLLLL
jgi:hypothetical protein